MKRFIPFIATFAVVFILVVVISMKGRRPGVSPYGVVELEEEQGGGETFKDLLKAMGEDEGGGEEKGEAKRVEEIDLKKIDLFRGEAERGEGKEITKKREIPEGTTYKELIERAETFHASGNLKMAKDHYEMAYELNPACSLCLIRAQRVKKELDETINKYYNDGIKYYEGLMFEEAIRHWELVITLAEDEEDERAQKAGEFIERAKKRIRKQF